MIKNFVSQIGLLTLGLFLLGLLGLALLILASQPLVQEGLEGQVIWLWLSAWCVPLSVSIVFVACVFALFSIAIKCTSGIKWLRWQ